MNHRLRERVNMGARGAVPLTDSHKNIHTDHLTYTLKVEERLEIVEKFFHFIKGYVESPNHDLPESHLKSLRQRITAVENDLKRVKGNGDGCC